MTNSPDQVGESLILRNTFSVTKFPAQDRTLVEQENERLWLVLEASQLALWDLNMASGQVEVDNRWAAMLGCAKTELEPFSISKFMELCHPEDAPKVESAIEQHSNNRTAFYQAVIRLRHSQGHWVWIKSTGKIVSRDDNGKPLRMTGVHENVNEMELQKNAGEIARSQLETAQRLGGLGSWYLDLETDKVTWSDELFAMQGLKPQTEPPPAETHHQLFSPESWDLLADALKKTSTEGAPYELELEMFNSGKFRGWMLARAEAIRDSSGKIVGVLGVAQDITKRKAKETELRKRALRDPLTQLGNRVSFDIGLAQAMKLSEQTEKTFALVMLDIDHFKDVNDRFGHEVGDRTLVQVGERLRSTLRGDDQIFRVGGDEFIVILADSISAEKSVEIAERLVLAFRRPLIQLSEPLISNVSAGLVIWDKIETAASVVKRADEALYDAKTAGRNQLATTEI